VLAVVVGGCTGPAPAPSGSGENTDIVEEYATVVLLPPVGTPFDYQLGGAYPAPAGVSAVVRDGSAEPAGRGYDICYVNGFQSQPGVSWPDDLLLHTRSGELLVDPGWPDEHLFDISTAERRSELATLLAPVVAGCAEAGYEAVEFDNLDSYTRSEGALTLEHAVAFASLLVTGAKVAGLAVAQKNTAELGARGRDEIGFDFAITEECDRYDECDAFRSAYDRRVLDIEYADDLRGGADAVCRRTGGGTIIRDRDLLPRGEPGYVYRAC
jgi:hypothetical protein